MQKYKVLKGFVFYLGPQGFHPGEVLPLTKAQIVGQEHKIELVSLPKKGKAAEDDVETKDVKKEDTAKAVPKKGKGKK